MQAKKFSYSNNFTIYHQKQKIKKKASKTKNQDNIMPRIYEHKM